MYTVLHIEPSEFCSNIVKNILQEKGYDYIWTDSFKEANAILYECEVDLIITSLLGREGEIESFVSNFNTSNKGEIPIFVVTGDNIDEKKKKLFNLGISDYILKENLQEEISKHIEAVFQEDQYMVELREARIAIVDDSSFESAIEEDLLKKYGVNNYDYYKSGRDLIESGKKYDIYLIDMLLKNEFGKNIIRYIRRNNKKATIIAVTVLNNPKTLAGIINAGADDFINKPIDENLFITKLKSNIRIYSLNKKINSFVKNMK
ncbi:response regulator [Clostridium lundense]|uniref:response regulator n=1 Tax=Clostridium lundense TaxID=319475 RepID=UPI000481A266|nr:response regulator [Clostridium lundense]